MSVTGEKQGDVEVSNQGSVVLFILISAAAIAWVEENVQTEGWQWMGRNTFAVDHRFASDLIEGLQAAGLTVH